MRKLLTSMLVMLWAASAQAQGTFTFSNRVIPAGLDAPIYHINGTVKVEGPHIVAAIFLNGTQLGLPAPFRTGVGAGYWNPGADSTREVPGRFSGDVVPGFTVKVWDLTKGATLEAARDNGGKFSESSVFSITLGGAKRDPALPPDLPGVMSNLQAFNIPDIPEPSALALGALGAGLMIMCRLRDRTARSLDS